MGGGGGGREFGEKKNRGVGGGGGGEGIPRVLFALLHPLPFIRLLRRLFHRGSSEGRCQVVGVNSLVKQFSLQLFCNGIKALAKEFLKSCPGCQLHKPFPTVARPPLPILELLGLSRDCKWISLTCLQA